MNTTNVTKPSSTIADHKRRDSQRARDRAGKRAQTIRAGRRSRNVRWSGMEAT